MSLKSKFRAIQRRMFSVRMRLTILFVLVFGLTMGGFGYATVEFLRHSLAREFDDALYNYAVDVVEGISLDSSGDLLLAPPQIEREKLYPFSLGTALVQIRHRSGQVLSQVGLWGDFKIPYQKEMEKIEKGLDVVFSTLRDLKGLPMPESGSYRIIHFPIDTSVPPQLILQIAVPTTILEKQLSNRHLAFEVGIPLVLLIATIASYLLASRALRPINVMISQANSIGIQELSRRLPVPAAEDEVRNLALTVNQMLERIEKAFQSQEKFVADASHQLLTPLTIMKSVLESAQKQGKMSPENIMNCVQEVNHLADLVRGLLALARVDAGVSALRFEPLYLDELVLEAISKVEHLAREKDIRMKFDLQDPFESGIDRPRVNGEEDLLLTLVFNLIENAVKYSPKESNISIVFRWTKDHQHLMVQDSGPGIAPGNETFIFERFRRGQNAQNASTPGFGLGLAIAHKIATVHGGKLWVENLSRQAPETSGDPRGAAFHFEIKNF